MEGYTIKSLIGEQVNPDLPIGECNTGLSLGDKVVIRSTYRIGIVTGLPDKHGLIAIMVDAAASTFMYRCKDIARFDFDRAHLDYIAERKQADFEKIKETVRSNKEFIICRYYIKASIIKGDDIFIKSVRLDVDKVLIMNSYIQLWDYVYSKVINVVEQEVHISRVLVLDVRVRSGETSIRNIFI